LLIYEHALVPLDGSALAEGVLPHISALAQKGLVKKITFIRVVEAVINQAIGGDLVISAAEWKALEQSKKAETEKYLEQLTKQLNFDNVEIKWEALPPLSIPDMISKYAKDKKVDLIVIATHGRSGLSRVVFGSVAEHVIRTSKVPVLVVRVLGSSGFSEN
jgi:nucleotide-binding universal stress UspA family protein